MTRRSADAAPATADANREAGREAWLDDPRDEQDARRGFIATREPLTITDDAGRTVWDLAPYDFLDDEAPDTVHPSLWRISRLTRLHGLYRVSDRVYQVRGFDISVMTVLVGDSGYVLIDPLTCIETAHAAMELVREQLGDRPVSGMLYTHSHIDHFGGAGGIVDRTGSAQIPVVAPAGFVHHAVVEHVNSGVAVSRRSQFMFGKRLAPGPRGQVSAGLGISLPSGRISLIEPNITVSHTGEELVIDGIRFVFQFTPGAEAPTEFNLHLPELRTLCMAETVSHHMHNLYTLRGAQVRDAFAWSTYLDEAIRLFAGDSDAMIISHHWPVWGTDRVIERISEQRDLYRYIHDQTLRLANHGLGPTEIAEVLTLPEELSGAGNRGNYGSLSHNAKAVYQRYLGWFDADPANLHPLPPIALGHRYVDALGGRDGVIRLADAAVADGDFRWAAELLKHALNGAPDDAELRDRQAAVFEQLGYQSESGPWRNFYLLTAAELRGASHPVSTFHASNAEMAFGMDLALLLDFAAIRLDGPRSSGRRLEMSVRVADRDEARRLILQRGVLRHEPVGAADGTVLEAPHALLARLFLGGSSLRDAVGAGAVIHGNDAPAHELFELLDDFAGDFALTGGHALPS